MNGIMEGLALLLTFDALVWLLVGLLGGFITGVLPGFDSANAAALLLALTIGLPTEIALIMMAAVYIGSQAAGSVPAILLNVPGEPGAAATALDGYPMTKNGQGGLAVGAARAASVFGGVLAGVAVVFVVGPMSTVALKFQSPEMFLVAIMGLTVIASVSGKGASGIARGWMSAFLGMLLASMAASPETGQPRMTFGFIELYSALPFVPVVIGIFGLAQMFTLPLEDEAQSPTRSPNSHAVRSANATGPWRSAHQAIRASITSGIDFVMRDARETARGAALALRELINVARSSFIGLIVGIVPGLGPSIANFVAYSEARRASKSPESFGKGNPEGVIASESCNNAVAPATLVPTLTLGVPGSATAAVMLGALYLHGVVPGPRVMVDGRPEVYAVLLSTIVAAVLILPVGLLLTAPLLRLAAVPIPYLIPIVVVIATVGALALRGSVFDAGLMVIAAILGVLMRLAKFPFVPLVLGLVLGPLAEANLMRSLMLSDGSFSIFWSSTTSKILLVVIITLVLSPAISDLRRAKSRSK